MYSTIPLLASTLLLSATAHAAIREHWWNITYTDANPDGLQLRRVIGVNGTWPPPVLTATQGDVIVVHATNGLGDDAIGTSLHSHGMYFNHSNWYDGATGVNQCPIPNGHTLDYTIDTSIQTGTYWIHGHLDGQNTDGLRSPVVIYPQNGTGRTDNVTWDEEFIVAAADWYHEEYPVLEKRDFLHWTNPTGAEPVPKSAVIYAAYKNGTYFSTNEEICAGEGVSDNLSIPFEAGKSYRIRMINMGTLAMFWAAMEGHEMYIIEMDGVEVDPYPIDAVTISVAQRYSVWVRALNQTDKNYAFMFMQDTDMYDAVPDDLVLNNTVQITYNSSAPPATPWIVEDITTFNDTELTPIVHEDLLGDPDVEIVLNAYFDTYDDGTNRASFNNITYQMPTSTPSMLTELTMGNDSFNPAVYGAMTNAFTYPHMAIVQLTVFNWDAGFHPFHLHGHEFQIVRKSFDVTSNDTTINPPLDETERNPARRDTVVIPPTGMVVLRWRADNPGAWMFHCHIDWHLSSGLAAVMIEAPEQFQSDSASAVPSQITDQCKWWGKGTEGNVVGKFSTTDFKGQPFGPFPLKMGWTPKAIGALAGCILTAIVGVATIVWYASGELDEEELEEEVKREVERKKAKVPVWKKVLKTNVKM
ncbi:acidic laccase [Cryptococcus gattii E566]|uniref:Iron transport multicopper oxidase FET3, putative n=2 Tax=Cryptococcus gattii TaxID=37769 RepID=E6RFK1_CRYGW|nr:Iron transport multicopper oxidase FET3 precursor, putative [Cryptococcus gattii WM276]ADV25598.1 Iron transport multicopper oxidase FET3 precursor, putative [Cryptococcus gattii WM276]KIR78769.1 acidic laccase [Cryptococcus gattii EJB2]KIY32794.1 acidic laccase [Cryptococcus gattii E566]KJD99903.1 acidic laccase [Cryptococcus gattii NT-10]